MEPTEEDEGVDDEDAEHLADVEIEKEARGNGLSWLMSRLSFVARRLIINKPSNAELISHPVSTHDMRHHVASRNSCRSLFFIHFQIKWTAPLVAIFQTFAALVDLMPSDRVKIYLKHICEPMYRVLDENGEMASNRQDAEIGMSQAIATHLFTELITTTATDRYRQPHHACHRSSRARLPKGGYHRVQPCLGKYPISSSKRTQQATCRYE